jgi:filamentous hemagglutinin family protein
MKIAAEPKRDRRRASWQWLLDRTWLAGILAGVTPLRAWANPEGMHVAQGTVSTVANGSRLDITASQNAVIDWQRFNIRQNETTAFHQPSSTAVVWNQIFDANPSQIWGHLEANGIVVLMNQNGFYFGPDSRIMVGGFVATTAPVAPSVPSGSGMWAFQGPPPSASIVNYGEIHAAKGGSLFLVAEKVENHGVLSAPDGTLGLYAGKEVLIAQRPDGRGLAATVRLPEGSVDNTGKLIADSGTVALHAQVVNQNGLIQANTVREHQGVIELVASEAINLGSQSLIQANGAADQISRGGHITINSTQSFSDQPGSRVEARGGAAGGEGGAMEISALYLDHLHSSLDGSAQPGWRGGQLRFDPYDITLTSSPDSTASSAPTVSAGDQPGSKLRLNVNAAFVGFSQVRLEATHDVTLENGTVWDLNTSTGISEVGCRLELMAGHNIVFGDNSRISSSGGWSVELYAGIDYSLATPTVRIGTGSVYLSGGPGAGGSGSIETADGQIRIEAGHELLVGGGYVRTSGGGQIVVRTGDGDVDAGTKNDGYEFTRRGAQISARGLGGISTAGGGDVNIDAGGRILGFTAPIGAFGTEPGNVNLKAGQGVFGHFMLRNGDGTIDSAQDVGSAPSPISLGLVNGGVQQHGWSVHAAQDLYLNEVYNPNGALNPNRVVYGARVAFQYDYASDATVTLSGDRSVHLLGTDLARVVNNADRPAIYAPRLSINAGSGGVELGNDLILYPSPKGSLSIHTTDGGSLFSTPGEYHQIVMSDSESADYSTFALSHAATPLHQGSDMAAVKIEVSGDLKNLFIRTPTASDMIVHGNVRNFAYEGQNLAASDITRLSIDGDYSSRIDRTYVTLDAPPNLDVFTDPRQAVYSTVASRLTWDPETRKLGFQGIMTESDRQALLHPLVYDLDVLGGRIADGQGGFVTHTAQFTTDTAAINLLFANTQDVPSSPLARNGLQIGGPGRFEFKGRNLDLGASSGIRTTGPLLNIALPISGASISVSLSGNLDMTSSQIASFNGGGIDVSAQGRMNVGSQEQFTSDDTPKGIYTGHGGDVTVRAKGDVSVTGSRIASYDGGDVTVISELGTVDAGQGAKGFFGVTTSQLDPSTGKLGIRNDKFFGSGIMALTRTDSEAKVGNIVVRANQDISANSGGILQLAFNQVDQTGASVTLDAGGSILANQSGVLGGNVNLRASKDIQGIVVANQNIIIDARQSVSVTALAGGSATVTAGDKVSGSIVSAGSSSVSGSEVSASVISTGGSASTSGDTSSAKVGAFAGVSAPTTTKVTEETSKTVASTSSDASEDDELKKKQKSNTVLPTLSRSTGRVTVILPK